MIYFTPEYLQFFEELEQNNDRDWFNANKERYLQHLKAPFEAFIADLIERARMVEPNLLITPKDAIFRIYRDTRFSKNKTPYKLHMSAVVAPSGRKDKTAPGLYLQFSHRTCEFYSGIYRADSKQLYRIREHLAAHPDRFKALLQQKDFVTYFGGNIHGERNKRIPKEFLEAAEQQDLIYQKAFYFYHHLPAETILQDNLMEVTMTHFQAARPLSLFFNDALADGV